MFCSFHKKKNLPSNPRRVTIQGGGEIRVKIRNPDYRG